ncbi:protein Shroom2-like isoform X2 [Arapaima gigas]
MSGAVEWRPDEGDGWKLVDVALFGEAPWGFTLTGGREYGEPLFITNVEEGSEAEAMQLQVGDEIISINGVVLSGYRQEAISLVKSSYKSLSLVIRRRIENVGRHHSLYSPKVTNEYAESARTQAMPIPARNMTPDSSSEQMHPNFLDQTNMQQVSSSLGSNDYIGKSSYQYYPRGLSARTLTDNTLVGSLHGSAYSSFLTSFSPKNMDPNPNQCVLTSRVKDGSLPHKSNNSHLLDEWPQFQQLPMGNGSQDSIKTYDQADFRSSSTGRPLVGPVWNIPDKKPKAQCLPPSSDDSFGLARAHKKDWILDRPGSDSQDIEDRDMDNGLLKDNDMDHNSNGSGAEVKHSCSPGYKNGRHFPHASPDNFNSDELTSKGHHSLHSTDLQPSQPVYNPMPHGQHRHSVESMYYSQPSYPTLSKTHNESNFYNSVQEFPANDISSLFKYAHMARSTAAVSRTSISENLDHSKQSRYYCMTAQQSVHSFAVPQASVKVRGLDLGTVQEKTDYSSMALKNLNKENFLLPQEQQLNLESDGYEYKGGHIHNQSASLASMVDTPAEKLNIWKWTDSNSDEIQEAVDPHDSTEIQPAQNSHSTASDSFATNVISEVQTRRAQVQKNKSAVTTAWSETEDVTLCKDECRDTNLSFPEGSSICYKNHLKAVQTQVLNATSFRRKDLDPKSMDLHGGDMVATGTVSNFMQNKPCAADFQGSRGGRHKHFPSEQKMHFFSAPDRINELGIEEVIHDEGDRTFVNEHRHSEASSNITLLKPMAKQAKQSSPLHNPEIKPTSKSLPEKIIKTKAPFGECSLVKGHSSFSSFNRDPLKGSKWQRGDAEHQDKWDVRKKPLEVNSAGPSSSGDKIRDKKLNKMNKPSYKHEKGRTSSSEDLSKQNHPILERGFTDSCLPEHVEQKRTATRLCDRRYSDGLVRGKPSPPDVLEPLTKDTIRDNSEKRTSAKHIQSHPNETPHSRNPELPSDWSHSPGSHQHSTHRKKESLEEKCYQVQLDALETTASTKHSQGSLHSSQESQSSKPCSPCAELPLDLMVPWGSLSSCENPHLGVGTEDEQGVLERAGVSSSYMECRLKLQLHTRSQQFSSHGIKLQVSVTIQDECRMENMVENTTVEEAAIMAIPTEDMEEERHQRPLPKKASSSHQLFTDNMGQRGLGHRTAHMAHTGVSGVNMYERPLKNNRMSSTPGPNRTTKESWKKDTIQTSGSRGTDSMLSSTSVPTEQFPMRIKNTQEQIQEHDSELAASLSRKLQVLQEAQKSMQQDVQVNDALGEELDRALQKLGKPNELNKFRMFVGDVDKVVSLLMALTSRLARVQKALSNLDAQMSPKEKRSLLDKRKQLIRQHQDARELKKDLDHRERVVYNILAHYLSEDRLASYVHFVKMKSVLITEQRKLEDKIRLHEEQLRGLMDSLPSEGRFMSKEDLPFCPDLLI